MIKQPKGQETIRYFKPHGLPCIQAVHGTNVANEHRRHAHNGCCIGIIHKGSRVVNSCGISTTIPENNLFVLNPGQVHACTSENEKHDYFVISVTAEKMATLDSQINRRSKTIPYFRNICIHDRELTSTIRHFHLLVENSSTVYEKESVLNSLLSTLIVRHAEESPVLDNCDSRDRAVEDICELIKTQYSKDLTLSKLSVIAGLSPFYLQRMFVKKTGFSPHEYLVHIRIKKARELLMKGNEITHVAFETGFADQSHFTRCFKRLIGTTPGDFYSVVNKSH